MIMESSLKNMVLTLLVITLVSAISVGLVYKVTAAPIAKANADNSVAALKAVLPEFDNNPIEAPQTVDTDGTAVTVYTARKGGQVVGYAVQTLSSRGFSGPITLMAGFKPDGEIINIEVLNHSETPGLGDKIENSKSNFSVQFKGKNPATFRLSVKKDGGDVDAITASTISSRAYSDAVMRAYNAVKQITGEK